MKSKQTPFYILIIGIFITIISPFIFSEGMFMDGLLYAIVSKNLAEGHGSFWFLQLTETLHPDFFEHPPLAFGLQSIFFRIFGDSIFIERFYSIGTFFITGFIITRIWKRITTTSYHQLAWLPLLFWVSIPLITWAAPNNMLENTMMIFTSLSVLFMLKSIDNHRIINLFLAGIMLFLGFLSKGLVAFFPLAFIFWLFVFRQNLSFKRFIFDSFIVVAGLIFPILLLYLLMPQGIESLSTYFSVQIMNSINNVQTVGSRFFIIWKLVQELIPLFVIVMITLLSSRKIKTPKSDLKWVYIFLALGLSGVIPIMISMKQSGFYILATFAFFSLAIAYYMAPKVLGIYEILLSKKTVYRTFKYLSYSILVIGIIMSVTQTNHISRDQEIVEDARAISNILPTNLMISAQPEIRPEWSMHGYLYRHSNISLETKTPYDRQYLLVKKGYQSEYLNNYKKVNIDLHLYDLYETMGIE